MKTIHARLGRPRLGQAASAAALLLVAAPSQPCHAQGPVQDPAPGQYPAPGAAPGYPAQPGQFPGEFPPAGPQTPPPAALPEGVSRLYALEGTNDLLAMATPEGYDRLRELVRILDGDLDAVQIRVVSADVQTGDLAALGVTLTPAKPSVTGADAARLLSALQAGNLRATETLRITTREDTAVDTLLRAGAHNLSGGTPFELIPREDKNGLVTLEIHQPTSVQVAVASGQTAVVALPGMTTGTVRLLFLTPTVLASRSRSLR